MKISIILRKDPLDLFKTSQSLICIFYTDIRVKMADSARIGLSPLSKFYVKALSERIEHLPFRAGEGHTLHWVIYYLHWILSCIWAQIPSSVHTHLCTEERSMKKHPQKDLKAQHREIMPSVELTRREELEKHWIQINQGHIIVCKSVSCNS